MTFDKVGRPLILSLLPNGYTYKIICVTDFKELNSFECEFKIKLESEDSARKWKQNIRRGQRKLWCMTAVRT